jgi:hypothetical protein
MFIWLNYGRFIHFHLLLQKNAERSHATDHKEARKRKRKKQILIAELYESPIQGSSISDLLPADQQREENKNPNSGIPP